MVKWEISGRVGDSSCSGTSDWVKILCTGVTDIWISVCPLTSSFDFENIFSFPRWDASQLCMGTLALEWGYGMMCTACWYGMCMACWCEMMCTPCWCGMIMHSVLVWDDAHGVLVWNDTHCVLVWDDAHGMLVWHDMHGMLVWHDVHGMLVRIWSSSPFPSQSNSRSWDDLVQTSSVFASRLQGGQKIVGVRFQSSWPSCLPTGFGFLPSCAGMEVGPSALAAGEPQERPPG